MPWVVDYVKCFRHYLQGPKFRIRTDHTPLCTVLKVMEPEGQLAMWIEFMDSFSYDIEYQEGSQHQNTDAKYRRPCGSGCKWCKEWKKDEHMVSAALQTDVSKLESKGFAAEQTEIPQDKQGETEFLSTLNIVHHVSPTLNATPSDGKHLRLESTFMASKERIPASRS